MHLGGDEVSGYTEEEYVYFMGLTAGVAAEEGKTVIGWQELGASDSLPIGEMDWTVLGAPPSRMSSAIELMHSFLNQGGADHHVAARRRVPRPGATPTTPPSHLDWAGPTDVAEAYGWDPARVFDSVGDDQVLGLEAPLWTETVASIEDVGVHGVPSPRRALAEIGWSPAPAERSGPRLRRVRDRAWSPSSGTSRRSV